MVFSRSSGSLKSGHTSEGSVLVPIFPAVAVHSGHCSLDTSGKHQFGEGLFAPDVLYFNLCHYNLTFAGCAGITMIRIPCQTQPMFRAPDYEELV